jgi:periplasmic protein TonB
LHASAGTPPRSAKQQFTPPVVLQQQQSKLMVEPTVVANLNIQSSQIGDPLSKLVAPANGVGVGGGIGSGDGGGVGSGHGGPGVGSGIFHLGDSGVSAPKPIYSPEPEFSEEARKAKYQGLVGLNVVVGPDGRIHSAQVVKSLGMGLDEKAIETVRLWKFDPAKKDGRPVAVAVYIEVDFHLY